MTAVPKVSVEILTYNHRPFISKALESVLMQRVSFDYEIVVGDDCSTDGTVDVLREYAQKCPVLHVVMRDRNIGPARNFTDILRRLRGEYVAYLEGDDYWTDPDKLQLQVDYLDGHRGCALVHHRVDKVLWPDDRIVGSWPPSRYRRERPSPEDLSRLNYIQTCALMFRRDLLPRLDDAYEQLTIGDWPLCVMLSQRGWIGFIDRVMAHYRLHQQNNWHQQPPKTKLIAMEAMAQYLTDHVCDESREQWRNMLVALGFADVLIAIRGRSLSETRHTLKRVAERARDFGKPLLGIGGLWGFCEQIFAIAFGDLYMKLRHWMARLTGPTSACW